MKILTIELEFELAMRLLAYIEYAATNTPGLGEDLLSLGEALQDAVDGDDS